jgi:hypothetical protein
MQSRLSYSILLLESAASGETVGVEGVQHQREGMGLLEYQTFSFLFFSSLRDVAHDGVLCTFINRSAPDQDKWCGPPCQVRRHGPSITYKITSFWVTLRVGSVI